MMTLLIAMMTTTTVALTTAITTDCHVIGFQEHEEVGSAEIKHINIIIIILYHFIWFADPQRIFFRFAFIG